ncbi:DNA-binding transcriptional LysR family regulator [Vibrio crassostreae]|uniref:LysR family transcriptional regulator n=1 Tax=Vibrio crassostreae TaxID=246167 RepID=UPI000F489CF3|nr:LysR family transcriptional regulator [Vibrio crassostreae]ROP20486.1 DNA-binding transcriptional LysR family regulator [Vibrio crassostreae]ROP22125.1 DNA-binding transcriptional LysR family regulator [Vibrio crassostreae]RPE95470.1 DNA-binding transcriptional LysR family regulator [Vibrio crassostreae]RPF04680.1 DNA-binding transcriptional LysR family regulator [Vibrio crassostreae]TCN68643.1 DNA-binding transcriptional LysR family regulator [Vibrio crassostreae]
MNFSIEQLLAFVTVYDQLSFSKAAVKLNKHRTTIGQVITNLEDQLAVNLFDRVGRSVEPTEDGHLLYHYAKQTIEQARTFDKVALSLSYGGLENITIAYSSVLPQRVLVDIRKQLKRDFPMMRVNFLVRNKKAIKQGIQSGEYHFGLVNVHDSRAMHSLDATFLGHLEFYPFVKKNGEFSNLDKEDVLVALKNSKQFVLKSLVEEGMSEKIVVSSDHEEIDQLALIIKLVEEGLGWALLPRSFFSDPEFSQHEIEPIQTAQMFEGFKFGFALWSPHSKQVSDIRGSLTSVIAEYRDRLISNYRP